MKKTSRMLQVEQAWDIPLEDLLPTLIRENGIAVTAATLQVSRSAIYIWLAKLGMEVNHKATVTARGAVVQHEQS